MISIINVGGIERKLEKDCKGNHLRGFQRKTQNIGKNPKEILMPSCRYKIFCK